MSENFKPSYREMSEALKGDRTRHCIAFNLNKAMPEDTMYVSVPKLEEGVVSGHANNYLVNNVFRALVSRYVVKFAGEKL